MQKTRRVHEHTARPARRRHRVAITAADVRLCPGVFRGAVGRSLVDRTLVHARPGQSALAVVKQPVQAPRQARLFVGWQRRDYVQRGEVRHEVGAADAPLRGARHLEPESRALLYSAPYVRKRRGRRLRATGRIGQPTVNGVRPLGSVRVFHRIAGSVQALPIKR